MGLFDEKKSLEVCEVKAVINDIKAEINNVLKEPQYQHEGEDWTNGLIIAEQIIDKYISGYER